MNPGAAPAPSKETREAKSPMKLDTSINGKPRVLELQVSGDSSQVRFAVDSVEGTADVVEVEPGVYSILVSGRSFEVRIGDGDEVYNATVNGRTYDIAVRDPRRRSRRGASLQTAGPQPIRAPMPGKIVRVKVSVGDAVAAGDGLVVVEAMKMQNELKAPKAGTVTAVEVAEGGSVKAGEVLVVVE